MTISLQQLDERFQNYVAGYLTGDPDNDYHIDLKIRHSLRVRDLAARIVRDEKLDAATTRLSLIAALLHDTGRFDQYRTYATFHDPSSKNHARLGITSLLHSDLMSGFSTFERRTVLGAVFLHNVRDLRPDLPEPLNTVVRVVRDSDKLDIIPVVLEHLSAGADASSKVTLDTKNDPARYTRSIYNKVLAGETANYRDMRWHNDFRLLLLGWVAGLNHTAARTIYRERGYAETLFAAMPDDAPMRQLRRKIALRLDSPSDHTSLSQPRTKQTTVSG